MQTIESFLLEQKVVSENDLQSAMQISESEGLSLGGALRNATPVDDSELTAAFSRFYGLPAMKADDWPKRIPGCNYLTSAFMRERKIVPLGETEDRLVVALADPGDSYASNAARLASNKAVALKLASARDIDAAIDSLTADESDQEADGSTLVTDTESDEVQNLKDIALGTPVVQLVNRLLQEALQSRATDIHIEPYERSLKVRYRIDGVLREGISPAANMARAIASRIKILAGLNIAERRLPQDGRARVKVNGRHLDLRIATAPALHGETVAIRLLDNVRRELDFSKLGFSTHDTQTIRNHLSAPHGMVIVTGPTGSGKTTTLATALNLLNEGHRKILTIEDPIEYELAGVNQIQAKPAIGLTFASALRSFLRHDPDVIMVGEMRDGETAGIGVNAALTGHLVLTTLHTNSAAGAIGRLFDMGVDGYLLASSLRCVIGQRLARRLCTSCRAEYFETLDLPGQLPAVAGLKAGNPVRLWKAVGCERCSGTGYADRIVLCEILTIDQQLRKLIRPGFTAAEIQERARLSGMNSMLADGIGKCLQGHTTPEEVRRVALDMS